MSPRLVLVVALGGALGALLRVAVGLAWPVESFPWSTLAVNVSGSAALAALPALAAVRRRDWVAPFLGTGVLGGYTTLSTAAAETLELSAPEAVAYAGLTLALCLAAVSLVSRLVRRGSP